MEEYANQKQPKPTEGVERLKKQYEDTPLEGG